MGWRCRLHTPHLTVTRICSQGPEVRMPRKSETTQANTILDARKGESKTNPRNYRTFTEKLKF